MKTTDELIAFACREADWHRAGIAKTNDPATKAQREFKADMHTATAAALKVLKAQERKTA